MDIEYSDVDFETSKRLLLKIQSQIPYLINDIDFLSNNKESLKIEEIQRGVAYITVGCSNIRISLSGFDIFD